MRVLVVGGSGKVGSLIMPLVAAAHEVRILDLGPPEDPSLDYLAGSATDLSLLNDAVRGMEALLYMAMGSIHWTQPEGLVSAFDVNVKGLYLALRSAAEAGIERAVFTSSMSVYQGIGEGRSFPDEELTPDASDLYGFTKRLGEEVCLNASRLWGLHVNVLRLCFPTAGDAWLEETRLGTPTLATSDEDVARAVLAALEYRGGYQAFTISGDYEQRILNMSKAKRLLDWNRSPDP